MKSLSQLFIEFDIILNEKGSTLMHGQKFLTDRVERLLKRHKEASKRGDIFPVLDLKSL